MSEAHRGDAAHEHDDIASGLDRDAKIEQLLLVGLDHYFAAKYELAINVWTRALFLDRSHARARAYIERARSALAEGQRESEELLQSGVAAFQRGESDEARRLLRAAIDGGAPSEEALAVLERLNRLESAASPVAPTRSPRALRTRTPRAAAGASRSSMALVAAVALGLGIVAGAGYAATAWDRLDWRSVYAWMSDAGPDLVPATAARPVARDVLLPLPRRGETMLSRARALMAGGHLRDALSALETVRLTDPQKAEADRMRSDIQRQLLALAEKAAPPAGEREKRDRRVP